MFFTIPFKYAFILICKTGDKLLIMEINTGH